VSEIGETVVANGLNQFEESPIEMSVHEHCKGLITTVGVSKSHLVLRCSNCGLRIPVPAEVLTLGDLRKHFERYQ